MLAKPTLATLLAVTVAMSVATGSVAGQSAEQFSASVFAHEAAGQYGWVYANLFPAQQKAISRTRYVTCSETRRRLTKQYLGIDFKSARLLKAPLPPKAVTAAVPGTHTTVRAVLVRWQVSMLVRGKREVPPFSIDGNVDHYFAFVGGRWRYVDDLVGRYLQPHCGMEQSQPASGPLAKAPGWARAEGFQNHATALAGARLFAESGCLNCHSYLGSGGHNLGAPDLSAEGAKRRGVAFQVDHLKCPACVHPGSPMPSYAGLGDANLRKLAAFLEASKGRR